jgi:hypothetical protein
MPQKLVKKPSGLNSYHQSMISPDKDGLNELNRNFTDEYSKGKINNEQYTNLKKEISASI